MRYARDDERSRARESVSANPYLLDVFTSSVRDVVADAGGWIVDRVLAGWTVTVITDAEDDGRVAQILGTKVVVRSEIAGQARPQPYAIALTSTLYGTDRRLRKCVTDALKSRRTEISIIGGELEGEWDPRLHPVAYRLSGAAQAFKMHALAAAGLPYSSVGGTEQFLGAALPARGQASDGKRRDRRRSRENERTLLPDCERTASSS